MATKIQLRRDTEANWTSVNPTLSLGELAFSTDVNKIKIGNGSSSWTSLSYITDNTDEITEGSTNLFYTSERVDDRVAALLTAGTNISLSYNDSAGTLTLSTIANPNFTTGAIIDFVQIGITASNVIDTSSSNLILDSAGGTTVVADDLRVTGNLTVEGSTTTIDSTIVKVEDKNIELGVVETPTDVTANLGGIILKGATDKSLTWHSDSGSWRSSENIDLDSGKVVKSAGTQILSATQYTGNAATATKWATARSITLDGDVSGTTNIDGSAAVTITAIVANDSHSHTSSTLTDFTENVQDIAGGMVDGSTQNGIAVTYDDTTGKLNFNVNDPTISLAGDATGSATMTNLANTEITVTVVNDSHSHTSSTLTDFTENVQDIAGTMVAGGTQSGLSVTYNDVTGVVDFNVSDPTISLIGDVTGSATMTNLGNVEITTTIAANSVALGTDTTGDYVATTSAGSGISVSGTGEGAAVTVTNTGVLSVAGTTNEVEVSASTGAVTISLPSTINANTTGNAATATKLATSRTVELTGDVTGSASFDGSANASITATIAANSVALGTDTTGDYTATVSGTTNQITATGTGEGAAVTISLPNAVTFPGTVTLNADPSTDLQAATKAYVDAKVNGLTWKTAANVLATSNVPLTGSTPLSVDSHTLSDGYRVVLTGQTTGSENGIYALSITGGSYTLARSADADAYGELVGASIFIDEGTVYGKTSWVQSNHYLSSFSGQVWTQVSGQGTYVAGTGLSLTGNSFANTGVTSIIGTSSQITASGSTGGVTLSLPSTINVNTSGSAATLTTGRTISLTGDVTYTSSSFDGSGNVTGTATLANSGVSANTYGSSTAVPVITVDAKGRVTGVSTSAIVSLPTQTGNSGKLLTTDGSSASWTAAFVSTVNGNSGAITGIATLASPALTGTPTSTTAAVDTNTTQIATTAYVVSQGYLKSATATSTYAPLAGAIFTGNISTPNAINGYSTTATAAGTTTLTVNSNYQQFFTGSTTQTIVLPVASTLTLGHSFYINNNSTGALTINSSGGNLVATIPANMTAIITCILASGTNAASWDTDFSGATTITGTGSLVLSASPTFTGTVTVPTPSNQTDAATKGYADSVTTNTQSSSYTLVIGDTGKTIEMNNASANTLTVPPNSSVAFPVGTRIEVTQYGAGKTTIAAGVGVTLRSRSSYLGLYSQYSGASLYKRATDEWIVIGDLVA